MKWLEEKETLKELIDSGKSYEEIGKIYNCSGSNIRKVAQRIGITLKTRRKVNPKETFNKGNVATSVCRNCGNTFASYPSSCNIYCSCKCQHEYLHK